jgi:glycogen synthase
LGRGYDYSLWIEKSALEMADAIIAVSQETKNDLLSLFDISEKKISVIHNGIDLEVFSCKEEPAILKQHCIDPYHPYILFVGRITRQKGMVHLLRAIDDLNPNFQIVLCADAPDTPQIESEIEQAIKAVQERRAGVVWVRGMPPGEEMRALYSSASLFVCPSIYEPFGIINLEAMACGLPVVASAVGGIQEVVVDGVTGSLVSFDQQQEAPFEPLDPQKFSSDLATEINRLMAHPALRATMGRAGRERVERYFSWRGIAEKTARLYAQLVASS